MTTSAIDVQGLRKRFGEVVALDGLDLEVPTGTVFGLLGPNGRARPRSCVLATLLQPTAGRATVLGHDVVGEPLAVRRRIGLAGQLAAVDGELTGRENLEMIGRLYRLSGVDARARAGELLERFALDDAANRRVATYSGGCAAGLISPRV
jgi:ABC-type multidrug transport system ATPase subunit